MTRTLVQCCHPAGNCHEIMPDDFVAIYLHYATEHDQDDRRPVEPVRGGGWDVAELLEAP